MNKNILIESEELVSTIIAAMANGWTLDLKIKYISQVLPKHYVVKESKQKGNIHCKSSIGIGDDGYWECFMNALRNKFTDFLELDHNTCYNHVDFTIYFKSK